LLESVLAWILAGSVRFSGQSVPRGTMLAHIQDMNLTVANDRRSKGTCDRGIESQNPSLCHSSLFLVRSRKLARGGRCSLGWRPGTAEGITVDSGPQPEFSLDHLLGGSLKSILACESRTSGQTPKICVASPRRDTKATTPTPTPSRNVDTSVPAGFQVKRSPLLLHNRETQRAPVLFRLLPNVQSCREACPNRTRGRGRAPRGKSNSTSGRAVLVPASSYRASDKQLVPFRSNLWLDITQSRISVNTAKALFGRSLIGRTGLSVSVASQFGW
jgi:hypothetical protein